MACRSDEENVHGTHQTGVEVEGKGVYGSSMQFCFRRCGGIGLEGWLMRHALPFHVHDDLTYVGGLILLPAVNMNISMLDVQNLLIRFAIRGDARVLNEALVCGVHGRCVVVMGKHERDLEASGPAALTNQSAHSEFFFRGQVKPFMFTLCDGCEDIIYSRFLAKNDVI